MATGHDNCSEDALLQFNDTSESGTIIASSFGAISKLQSILDNVCAGVNEIQDAFAAFQFYLDDFHDLIYPSTPQLNKATIAVYL